MAFTTDDDLRFTPTKAASLLGISTESMRRLLRAGAIESVLDGRRRWVRPQALTAYLDNLPTTKETP